MNNERLVINMEDNNERFLLISTVRNNTGKVVSYNILEYHNNGNGRGFNLNDVDMLRDSAVENIRVEGAVIKGTNGTIDRYPKLIQTDAGFKQISFPLVVISRINDGFIVNDGTSNIMKLSSKDAVAYAKLQGIANGKVVKDTETGKETISSIKGNYAFEDVWVTDQKAAAKKPAHVDKYSKDFYKAIERAFGKERANLFYYLVEKRDKIDAENFARALTAYPKQAASCIGLMVLTDDIKAGKKDDTLIKLVSKIVEPKAIEALVKAVAAGKDFTAIWDAKVKVATDVIEEDSKYEVTYKRILPRIESVK